MGEFLKEFGELGCSLFLLLVGAYSLWTWRIDSDEFMLLIATVCIAALYLK